MDSARRANVRLLAVTLMVVLVSPALTAGGLPFPWPAKDLRVEIKARGLLPQRDLLHAPRRSNVPNRFPMHPRSSTSTTRTAFPDTILVYSTGDTTRHVCSYNGTIGGNELALDVTEKLTSGSWEIISRYTYTTIHSTTSDTYIYLNETWHEGRIEMTRVTVVITLDSTHFYRTETHEAGENGVLVNKSREMDTSDTEGLNASWVSQTWEVDRWVNQTRSSTTTDSTRTRLVSLTEQWQGGMWVNDRRATQTFNSAWPDWGYTKASELDEVWLNGEWVYDYRVTSTTQALPRTYQETSEQWTDGIWTNTSRVTYSLDDLGRETARLYEIWISTQWIFSLKMTWTYDPRGAVACTSTFSAENGSWIEEDRTTSSYDSEGHLVGVLIQRNAAGQMQNVERYTYAYDTLGRCVEGSHDIAENGAWYPWDGNFDYLTANSFLLIGYHFLMIYPPPLPTSVASDVGKVEQYSLSQNYPNPFNPKTVISYQLSVLSHVRIAVYDLIGREVAILVDERKAPGRHRVSWDGSSVSSGVYICRMTAGAFAESRKMVLMR